MSSYNNNNTSSDNINDYNHLRIDVNTKEIFISYPLAEHLWGTYHGDSSTIDKFLVKVITDFMSDTDPDYEFNLSGYKWFIYDNECFEGHNFAEVLDAYWFEEDIQFGQFLIDYIITVDINTVSRHNTGMDWETNSSLNNFDTIQLGLHSL
ncbi:5679_t:CDS:2 [Ambispora leptoticha]|uniref:5679_t:CDS:1 n=1 Tax=Ambispora leptoticha TaxID=144679 RepID=A0A9N9IC85_9GLOM|nr:5679_t:CDS:2 [Ambispora leptoticha]